MRYLVVDLVKRFPDLLVCYDESRFVSPGISRPLKELPDSEPQFRDVAWSADETLGQFLISSFCNKPIGPSVSLVL